MMRDSNYEAVWCSNDDCNELMRVRDTVARAFGGRMYCDGCIEARDVPDDHPQNPDNDVQVEI